MLISREELFFFFTISSTSILKILQTLLLEQQCSMEELNE